MSVFVKFGWNFTNRIGVQCFPLCVGLTRWVELYFTSCLGPRLMSLTCIVTLSCVPSTYGRGWNLVPLLKKPTLKIIKHRMLVHASLPKCLEHALLHATCEVVLKYSLPSSSFTLSPRFGGPYTFSAFGTITMALDLTMQGLHARP